MLVLSAREEMNRIMEQRIMWVGVLDRLFKDSIFEVTPDMKLSLSLSLQTSQSRGKSSGEEGRGEKGEERGGEEKRRKEGENQT